MSDALASGLTARFAPALSLTLMVLVGCASGDWTHRPTALRFPAKLGALQRSPVRSSQKSERIAYSSGSATELLITIAPLDPASAPDLPEILAERTLEYASSLPPARPGRGPYRGWLPARCSSEPSPFAYHGFPSKDDPLAAYGSDWWLAGRVSNHLVVIESHLRGNTYAGGDSTLRSLFALLGWPCELPYNFSAATPLDTTRPRPSAAKSSRSPVGVFLARLLPVAPPGRNSTIGVRQVDRAPAPGTYAHARKTGEPHHCEVDVPSFFGERMHFDAYVEGDDFIASARGQHFARVHDVGYGWREDGGTPVAVAEIRLDEYRTAYERLMDHPPPRWDDFFVFVEPSPEESCAPSPRERISVPEQGHQDITAALLERQREYFDKAVATVGRMPFGLLMPDPSLKKLFPGARGAAGTSGYGFEYYADAPAAEGGSSQLTIGFSAHGQSPASACSNSLARNCEAFAVSKRGTQIFRNFQITGSSSQNPRSAHYYAHVGDATVHISYVHWKSDARGENEFSGHEFAEGELESIFDSLKGATPGDVVRFPGMIVSAD